MGIHWVVKDPDGIVVEDYQDWASVFGAKIELDPGDDHEFIGGRFDLNKEGTYTTAVSLLMNPDNPVVVDSYEGDLCTTTLEVPPEYEPIQEIIYPWAYTFEGDAETCIFEFTLTPESETNSQRIPPGYNPASWHSSTTPSVCPSRSSMLSHAPNS
ncbi:unnamed protein product [marine sediment metagenome]|uniref:Uncharacterized protein n=1 Tax=marine sediment metagenome TaxID=412755 RepID=X1KED2_9ZZZZ